MRKAVCWAAVLAVQVGAWAQPDTASGSDEARAILEKASAAMREVKTAGYEATYRATEWIQQFVPNVEGKAVVGPPAKYDVRRFFAEVAISKDGSEEVQKLAGGCDGHEYFLVDHQTKTVHRDMDQAVMGSQGRNVTRIVLNELTAEDPFGESVQSGTVELKEEAEVDGTACHVVHVKPSEGPEMTWYFAKQDFLPRRVVRHYKNREGEPGVTELTLTKLVVNPSFVRSPFEPVVPEGYEKTSEFAP